MIRAIIVAATIALLVIGYLERPKPVERVEVPYCVQPIWDQDGNEIGGKWIICSELDRYENA